MRTIFSRFGREVKLGVPESLQSEVDALSPRLKYLVTNGWNQALLDSYASAKDELEFEGKLFKKYDAILAGEVRVASEGGTTRTTDPVEKEFNRLVREKLAAWIKERKTAGKPKPSDELQQVWLDRYVETRGEELRAVATENVANVKAVSTEGLDSLLDGLED